MPEPEEERDVPSFLPFCCCASAACSICLSISLLYSDGLFCFNASTTDSTSVSLTKQPCIRCAFGAPSGSKSISPFPRRLSAPSSSSMIRELIPLETASAMRDGIFAFIVPVMTSAEGRCVAIIRCIPAARAICARRITESSTSLGEAIIKSASSSIIITICGRGFSPSSRFALKPLKSRTPFSVNI